MDTEKLVDFKYKDGFLYGMNVDGSRLFFKEQVYIYDRSLKKYSAKPLAVIREKIFTQEVKTEFEEKIVEKVNTQIGHIKNIFGNIWVINNELAIVRIITIEKDKKNKFYPIVSYKIWILGETKKYEEIEISLETFFNRTAIGPISKNGKATKMGLPPPSGDLEDLKNHVFRILYRDKLELWFYCVKSRFNHFNWKITENKVVLKYKSKVSNFIKLEDLKQFTDIILVFRSDLTCTEYDNHHFVINKNDWISALGIMSSFFLEKENKTPIFLKSFRKASSYSKVSFRGEESLKELIDPDIFFYQINKDMTISSTIDNESSTNIIEIDLANRLKKCFNNLHNLNGFQKNLYEVIFVLPKKYPIISLTTAPFIRYSRGFPILNSPKLVSKILSCNTIQKKVYFVGLEPSENIRTSLKAKGYNLITIYSKKINRLLQLIQQEFLRQYAVDSLISSYSVMSETIIDTETVKLTKDRLEIRANLVKSISKKAKQLIIQLFSNNIDKNLFLSTSFKLTELVETDKLSDMIEIGRLCKELSWKVENKRYVPYDLGKLEEPHFVLYDMSLPVESLIAISLYATYRGLLMIPFDIFAHKSLEEKNISTDLIENIRNLNFEGTKNSYKEYGERLSKLISPEWRKIIEQYIGKLKLSDTSDSKLEIGPGLGYISLFIKPTNILYEAMMLNNLPIGSLFSIGRFQSDNASKCLKAVRFSFEKWEKPRPKWKILSINFLTNKSDAEFAVTFTREIFEVFKEIGFEVSNIINPKSSNLAKLIQLLEQCSFLILWTHGNSLSIEITKSESHKKKFSLEEITKIDFIRPDLAFINSCGTGGYSDKAIEPANIASTLLVAGFKGVCAPFWLHDTKTASSGLIFLFDKIDLGSSIASIIRNAKLLLPIYFPQNYVYYGDPTYNTDMFYPNESDILRKKMHDLQDKIFKTSSGEQMKIYSAKSNRIKK